MTIKPIVNTSPEAGSIQQPPESQVGILEGGFVVTPEQAPSPAAAAIRHHGLEVAAEEQHLFLILRDNRADDLKIARHHLSCKVA